MFNSFLSFHTLNKVAEFVISLFAEFGIFGCFLLKVCYHLDLKSNALLVLFLTLELLIPFLCQVPISLFTP